MAAGNWLGHSGFLITITAWLPTELNAPSFVLPGKIYLKRGKDPMPELGLYPESLLLFTQRDEIPYLTCWQSGLPLSKGIKEVMVQ